MDSLKDRAHRSAAEHAGSAAVDDLPFPGLSVESPDELQVQCRSMQELICYLLRRNQRLRMELSAASAHVSAPLRDD